MELNIKEKIEEILKKIKEDGHFAETFKADPIQAIEGVLGVDLPDDTIKAIAAGVKAKLGVDSAGDLLGKVKNLF